MMSNVLIHQNKGTKLTTTLDFMLWFKPLYICRIVRVEINVSYLRLSVNNLVKCWNISIVHVLSVIFLFDRVHIKHCFM